MFIQACPVEHQGTLYAFMFSYLETGACPFNESDSIYPYASLLITFLKPSFTRRNNGKKGAGKQIGKQRRSNAEVTQKERRSNAEVTQGLTDNEELTSNFENSGFEEKEDTDKESDTKKLTEEKEEKNNNIIITKKDKARNALIEKVKSYADKYDRSMLNDFVRYWTEPVNEDDPNSKLKYQLQNTWSTGGRLATWYRKCISKDS